MKRLSIYLLLSLLPTLANAEATKNESDQSLRSVSANPESIPTILVLPPRSGQSSKVQAQKLSAGLQDAVKEMGFHLQTEDELAAATPGDIVARCPARISSNCLMQAAQKTASNFVLTGQIETHAEVVSVIIKIISAKSAKIESIRDINLVPPRHDELDIQLAGQCLGRAMLGEIFRQPLRRDLAPCAGRVFASSEADQAFYQQNTQAPPAQKWVTVLPKISVRQAYEKRNDFLAGTFASAGALAVVGLTTSVFLLVQSRLTHGEIVDFANQNPNSLNVQDGQIWVLDSSSEAAGRYRSLQARERMEALTSMSAGLGAVVAALVAIAMYDQAEIPGRYEAYQQAPADPFAAQPAKVDENKDQQE